MALAGLAQLLRAGLLDPKTIGPGSHELVVVATDHDGNPSRKTLKFKVR